MVATFDLLFLSRFFFEESINNSSYAFNSLRFSNQLARLFLIFLLAVKLIKKSSLRSRLICGT
jgi:hypothetical protein